MLKMNTLKINSKDTDIRARVVILCLMSAAGIYLSITNHVLAIALFVLNLASMLFLNNQEILWQMLFLLPFTTIYKYSAASSSLFTYLSLFAVLIFLSRNIRLSKRLVVLLVLFSIAAIVGIGNAYIAFVKLISNVMLLAFFVTVVKREIFPKMILAISLGEFISSIIGLRKTTWAPLSAFYYSLKEEHIGGEKIARFTGLYVDPNYYSIIVIICLYGLLLYMYKKEISYKLGIPLFAALTVFGCMTYSRVFYISFIGVLVAFAMIRFKNKSLIGTIALILIFVAVFWLFADKMGFIEKIFSRFQREDISSGRFDLWGAFLKEIINNAKILLIGAGLGGELPVNTSAHNFYIETVYHLGIIGTAIYFTLLCSILSARTSHIFKRGIANWALSFVLMFMFATLGMLFQFDFVYSLMLDWMVLNTNMKDDSVNPKGEMACL